MHFIFVYIITTIVFCSKASLGTLCSQKPQIICWLWLGKSYFLLVFKALCKCMADNLWIFPPGFAEEVPFLQANISWWSKRMQPQLLKCVSLLLINILAIRSKRGIWTINRPLWAFLCEIKLWFQSLIYP